ncbi:MAG TPA: hypothetical protein VLM85_26590, partial [Polyangiaceae bacterium]|nr:hypothetical protein [Polyangiaceae bacterium]
PPSGPAPAQADIDTINAWINGGYPQGSCGSDGGTSNPYNTATVCTSGAQGPTYGTSTMLPGEACVSCHSKQATETPPIYPLMGTIYPTAHEPNNCVGASSSTYAGVQIIATDSLGHSVTLTPNSVGNFMGPSTGSISGAYTIKITYQGRERDMTTPQTNGDCNSCHTETGTSGAPGRIMLP